MATIVIRRVEESAEKLGIAHLLYERDGPFVPVTPLAVLRSSTTFFKASLAGQPLRAASSYEEWLEGCDEPGDPLTSVYELASSIVREPLGGFASPSLQQLFSAVRLLDILYSRIPEQGERPDSFVSVVAAIAAQNARSLAGMRGLGMVPVDPLPRWLEYEHRSWFPKLARERERRIADEAHYLWMPPDAARTLFRTLAPVLDGEQPLSRLGREAGTPEQYAIQIAVLAFEQIRDQFGSYAVAAEKMPFDVLRPPPCFARLNGGRF